MNERQPVQFQIEGLNLPGAAWSVLRLGLQIGAKVVQDVPADAEEVTFRFSAEVGRNRKSGVPQFFGPAIHGPSDGQFVYLSWGQREGETWNIVRRAKLPLAGIGWELIQRATTGQKPVRIQLNMTDARGQPITASIKPNAIEWFV